METHGKGHSIIRVWENLFGGRWTVVIVRSIVKLCKIYLQLSMVVYNRRVSSAGE